MRAAPGVHVSLRALWYVARERAELRLCDVGEGVEVHSLYSGVSRGTERLVFEGRVPETEHETMRAPHQQGEFPFPVKYGYSNVGRAQSGTYAEKLVFALYPHQSHYAIDEEALLPLPEGLPPKRAVLAANMETALNILWDSGAGAGDRIVVIGAGVVGALTGYLAARLPGAEVTLVDLMLERATLAEQLGCAFALPEDVPDACDVVIHASATPAGLNLALDCAGPEATLVEASWYGAGHVPVSLGGAFHSKRLRLQSSQVGALPPARRPRWTFRRRLAKALDLLRDPVLDTLISGETAFAELPDQIGGILSAPETLCHRIRYQD